MGMKPIGTESRTDQNGLPRKNRALGRARKVAYHGRSGVSRMLIGIELRVGLKWNFKEGVVRAQEVQS